MSKPRKRRNQAPSGSLPVGKFIPVEAIRCNEDGTVNVIIRDENIPTALNRKRNTKKKAAHRPRKMAKKKNIRRKR
jgi:hypothetical protein